MITLNHSVTYPTLQLSLAPPASHGKVALDPADAFSACQRTGCPPGPPSVFLARATTINGGAQTFANTLVYVLRWSNVTCVPVVPADHSGPVKPDSCLYIVLVDPNTGEPLDDVDTNAKGG